MTTPAAPPTITLDAFFEYYKSQTNNGRDILHVPVLTGRDDLKPRTENQDIIVLTQDEVAARRSWMEQKKIIMNYYYNHDVTDNVIVSAKTIIDSWCVLPPVLNPSPVNVSGRSPNTEKKANRHYPGGENDVVEWADFGESVGSFSSIDNKRIERLMQKEISGELVRCFIKALCSDERQEECYLKQCVLDPLNTIGLIGEVHLGSKGCHGEPDFTILKRGSSNRESITIIGESKSTHNLMLPITASQLVSAYNEGRNVMDDLVETPTDKDRRPLLWSHVGHPLSQILGYMILNKCRYGVLTSGSKTYFIHLQNKDQKETVLVSDAWFVGQPSYLRAWAYFYHASIEDSQTAIDPAALADTWLQVTPTKANAVSKPPKTAKTAQGTKRQKNEGTKRGSTNTVHNAASKESPTKNIIPHVTLHDFVIGKPIGFGRRGTTFSATFRSQTVAVKLFDTSKGDGQKAFEKEVAAYRHLEAAWGRLIPTPKFTAEAFGICYLGMEMADLPSPNAFAEDWEVTLSELRERFGFYHLDLDGDDRGSGGLHNRMILHNKYNSSVCHPIVIDLEEYESTW